MPRYGVRVSVWDEGGLVIEAESPEAAEEALSRMGRDRIEGKTTWANGDCSFVVEAEELEDDDEPDLIVVGKEVDDAL